MLKVSAPFPHPGSQAFLAPDGRRVRIVQVNRDGTLLVHHHDCPLWDRTASSTLTANRADLFETAAEAIEQHRGARRTRRPYRRQPSQLVPA